MDKKELLKQKSILYVEDDEVALEALSNILKFHTKTVFTAKNGKEGLEKLKELKPDIVLTDLEMPVMNGVVFLQKIKEYDKNIPVVVITAFEDEVHLAKGADGVIVKPVKKELLLEILQKLA